MAVAAVFAAASHDVGLVVHGVVKGGQIGVGRTLQVGGEKADEFADAKVTYTELHTSKHRDGKLAAYYYNTLLKVVELQKYFEMNSEYAPAWVDALQTRLSVKIGDKGKTIGTSNEGEVPIELRTIYMAIDGAALHVVWADGKASNVTGLPGY